MIDATARRVTLASHIWPNTRHHWLLQRLCASASPTAARRSTRGHRRRSSTSNSNSSKTTTIPHSHTPSTAHSAEGSKHGQRESTDGRCRPRSRPAGAVGGAGVRNGTPLNATCTSTGSRATCASWPAADRCGALPRGSSEIRAPSSQHDGPICREGLSGANERQQAFSRSSQQLLLPALHAAAVAAAAAAWPAA